MDELREGFEECETYCETCGEHMSARCKACGEVFDGVWDVEKYKDHSCAGED